jgi:hypothetical protein
MKLTSSHSTPRVAPASAASSDGPQHGVGPRAISEVRAAAASPSCRSARENCAGGPAQGLRSRLRRRKRHSPPRRALAPTLRSPVSTIQPRCSRKRHGYRVESSGGSKVSASGCRMRRRSSSIPTRRCIGFPTMARCFRDCCTLAPRGVLAVQMPRNFAAPSHTLVAATVRSGPWQRRLENLLRPAPVNEP